MPFDGVLQTWELILLGTLTLSSISFSVLMCAVAVGARAEKREEENYQMMLKSRPTENRW